MNAAKATKPRSHEAAKGYQTSIGGHLFRALTLTALLAGPALAQSDSEYDLTWNTIDSGGVMFSQDDEYVLGGTIGQPDAGVMSDGEYTLTGGFWLPIAGAPSLGACCDHDPFGGCHDDRALDECTCGRCEWFEERTCEEIECASEPIPTVSQWGLVVLTLLLLTGAKIYFGRRAKPMTTHG